MKRFLVINTSFFGDILLTDPLCRNIKLKYPDSKITFIANKPFCDAIRYSDGVDEVIAYDKKGIHRGLMGAWRFFKQYKEKFSAGVDASFVIYGNERGIILSKLFGARKVYADNQGMINFLTDNSKRIDYHGEMKVQQKNSILLEQYTKEKVKRLAMKYLPDKMAFESTNTLFKNLGLDDKTQKFVAICTTSKRKEKDMPIEDCIKLFASLNDLGYTPLFLGAGKVASEYVNDLKQRSIANFIDLVDKTSIVELGALLTKCSCLISVDTGTMHLGLASGVPVVCLFYIHTTEHLASWSPDKDLYKSCVLTDDLSVDNIVKSMKSLIL